MMLHNSTMQALYCSIGANNKIRITKNEYLSIETLKLTVVLIDLY